MNKNEDYLHEISDYYSRKLSEFGATPNGVDWNGEASQLIRFEQLLKVVEGRDEDAFTVNDLGCGYAAIVDFLAVNFNHFSYLGFDLSEQMVAAAIERCAGQQNLRIKQSGVINETADFGLASGVFNVKLEHKNSDWLDYIKSTLQNLDQTSSKGFAFNCLTSYSDKEKMRDYLYYANPSEIFDFCKKNFSRNVALLHDYDLYEFTILVKKI